MKTIIIRSFYFILFLLPFAACQNDGASAPKAESAEEKAPKKQVQVPAFNRDSAYAYIEKQLSFGPRVPNTEEHLACKAWLSGKLAAFGAEVIEQDFVATAYTGEKLQSTNIIGQYNVDNPRRILLAAHWDTRPFADSPLSQERKEEPILGADDGASGVGVLLEIARQLQSNPIDLGVDIIFFDAEDYGESQSRDSWALGSQYWSRNIHRSGYRPEYGILLDMVGSRGARFAQEYYSVNFAPKVVRKVWRLANNMGYGNYFVNEQGGNITDDHFFVNTIAQIPMINIINQPIDSETGFGSYWHTHDDDIDIIHKNTLRAVGQVVLAVLYREEAGTI